jgi:hypothetical protein
MVDGQVLVDRFELTQSDSSEIIERAKVTSAELHARAGI